MKALLFMFVLTSCDKNAPEVIVDLMGKPPVFCVNNGNLIFCKDAKEKIWICAKTPALADDECVPYELPKLLFQDHDVERSSQ